MVGLVTALLTAYYMTRLVALAFYGGDRWKTLDTRTDARVTLLPMIPLAPSPLPAPTTPTAPRTSRPG